MKIVTRANELPHHGALVPTMGALHAGHAALIEQARNISENVIVSVFINPLQFESSEDLELYPSTPEVDAKIAKDAGATTLWLAQSQEIYPGPLEKLTAGKVGELYEGAHRFGHFGGVLTVVKRLFEITKPRCAVFGEKDFQQLFLIKKMVEELHLAVEIHSVETVRTLEGLALSSRNIRLGKEFEDAATIISQALFEASRAATLTEAEQALRRTLATEPKFAIDYAEIIDAATFDLANSQTRDKRAIVAGWINGVRLIDNMTMTGLAG
ncbi:unannotated protein [freshwater metagenome]|uniref:pantoate--beta-alanine ligase (AMP-forming) n=1 Tax=freshwater metagenome TaxID=449393 RepID=A0A6J6W799_9ZZZZ|nr:adenylyltransferase/cytidyltransferase family protein [Actinomycetota bacterium]MSW25733.1 adenylyltransferase/cytidyltransferase family protein [Actinomycetota bacterium]MSW33465.1 adenylyltransferase/cytidyltransferase family protein [Actinomycetota bacterium]MSX30489.1 adenylyltransferase/cytidyltransferase family protein [Actinomycetota bacterium]MSX51069.1 adenylyltransferase/cytidyltransferase family protein [Actinomycetota bacterium]